MQNLDLESRIDGSGRVLALADRLEGSPRVCPTDLQGRVVGEDVVAEVLQGGLGIRRGELSRLLHLFTDGDIDFLSDQKCGVLNFCSSEEVLQTRDDGRNIDRQRPNQDGSSLL